jgi:uncharacterized membrane protein YjjP (DUF1212 family)
MTLNFPSTPRRVPAYDDASFAGGPAPAPRPAAHLSPGRQRQATRLCAVTGLMLLQHSAESALVESLTRRLGLALGVDHVEVALMANAITVTTIVDGECITTVRRNEDRGVNMHMVMQVQRAALAVEAGRMDADQYQRALAGIVPLKYARWATVAAIGLSCACFARLAGADWAGCGLAFAASALAMVTRHVFAHYHFNPMIGFLAAGFVATSITAQGFIYQLGNTPKLAMAASVLLLVPGFPLINGVSDIVKGYANTGISRLVVALLLSGMSCIGIMLGMLVWDARGWLS